MYQLGDRIGPWEVQAALATGGTFACRHADSDRRAMVRLFPAPADRGARDRLLKDVGALVTLDHRAIARVLGGEIVGERLWVATEAVEGPSLRERLQGGPLDWVEALHVFKELTAAVAYAHDRGIYHASIDADAVVLSGTGPQLLRFQIPGVGTGCSADTAPPESFRGVREPVLADLYALGVLLHQCLVGTHAFAVDASLSANAAEQRVIQMKADSRPLDPGEAFPGWVRACVRVATDPDPLLRMPSVHDLADCLTMEGPPRRSGEAVEEIGDDSDWSPDDDTDPTESAPAVPPREVANVREPPAIEEVVPLRRSVVIPLLAAAAVVAVVAAGVGLTLYLGNASGDAAADLPGTATGQPK